MRQWLAVATDYATLLIDAMALLIIVLGTVEAFLAGVRIMLHPSRTGDEKREVWLRYARWLVAGLTFQLAADIVETSVAPTWDAVGKLAVIAMIRTFLNFFLERDLAEMRERQRETRNRN